MAHSDVRFAPVSRLNHVPRDPAGPTRWRHAGWGVLHVMLAVVATACNLEMTTPPNALLACAADTDCPDNFRCLAESGRCVDANDQLPPGVVSVNPPGSRRVLVTFDEGLDAARASTAGAFSIADLDGVPLPITGVSLQPGERVVQLETERQVPSADYVLTLTGVTDRAGNNAPTASLPFVGFGYADREPPAILSPAQDAPAFALTATLDWTTPEGADSYAVEISLDADFSVPAPGSPFVVDQPPFLFTAGGAATHWARVRADVTRPGEYSTPLRIEPIGDVLHVYCAAAPPAGCGADGEPEIGNRNRPYRSLRRALDAARARDIAEVWVAARPNGAPYDEALFLTGGGLTLRGGFNPDFAVEDPDGNAVPLRAPGSSFHRITGIHRPTVVSGFVFSGSEEAILPLTLDGTGEDLVVRDCVSRGITSNSLGASVGLVVSGSDGLGPHLERVTVEVESSTSNTLGLFVNGGPVRGDDLRVGVDAAGGFAIGLQVVNAEVRGNGLRVEASGGACVAIGGGNSDIHLVDSALSCQGGDQGAGISVNDGRLQLIDSFVHASAINGNGVGLSGGTNHALIGSVIDVVTASEGKVLMLTPRGGEMVVHLWHNTIDGSAGAQVLATLETLDTPVTGDLNVELRNNLWLCNASGTQPAFAESEYSGAVLARPSVSSHNAFVGCAGIWQERDTGNAPLDLAAWLGVPGVSGDFAVDLPKASLFVDADGLDDLAATLDDNDWGLRRDVGSGVQAAQDAIASGGATINNCGGTDQPACPVVDSNGVARTPPPSVGARERD